MRLDYGDRDWVNTAGGEGPFDAVVSGFSIHHQPDERKRQLYGEIFDQLSPGGLFLNLEHVSSPTRWIETVFEDYFVDALHDMHRRDGSGRSRQEVADEFYRRPDKDANILAPLETQCDWLRTIGFEDVDCYFKAFELALFGGRRPAAVFQVDEEGLPHLPRGAHVTGERIDGGLDEQTG